MHIGVIPDGNRRYANSHGIGNYKAYRKARDTVKHVTDSLQGFSDDVDSITFYLLSEENLKREEEELETLFQLLEENIDDMADFFQDKDFKVNWGSTKPEALPERLAEKLESIQEQYSEGETTVNLLISYSGKKDILQASEKISRDGGSFSEDNMSKHLEVQKDIDFVIRTGDNPDRECLSGFPIWNSSYAEFYHIRKNFPAIEPEDVEEALNHFEKLRKKKGE
ncbi:undecaprenyl diphosphate synthase family protein [Candidatus Nanosalina sp. VS9-1]|uniref:undecaprenyl diphosphate synthase family protein n=1 Tax=Candidatus Nanosalina sp. VS9-1 TaxID=3388566 RepID=UPI0039E053A8